MLTDDFIHHISENEFIKLLGKSYIHKRIYFIYIGNDNLNFLNIFFINYFRIKEEKQIKNVVILCNSFSGRGRGCLIADQYKKLLEKNNVNVKVIIDNKLFLFINIFLDGHN